MQQLLIYQNKSDVIIFIYPGYNGDADGYNDKYKKIGALLCEKNIGAVARASNKPISEMNYEDSVKAELKTLIDNILIDAKTICGSDVPRLYLMGVSAGASAIAAIAHEYPEVEKILLIAPSGDAGFDAIKHGLANYKGELYIVVGANDEVVGSNAGKLFSELASKARMNKFVIVSNCNHQFRGEINGKIFSKAPLWAFADDSTFPSPDGGIKLYD